MRSALITTLQHNPGDDFVRDGIKFLLKKQFGQSLIFFQSIHKHTPVTARYGFGKLRRLRQFEHLDQRLPLNVTRDKILKADLVVQCGAPIYWCHEQVNSHCCDNEWFEPLIRRRLAQAKNARFLNIAGGSCQTYFSDGSEVCPRCLDYIKELYNLAALTTLRDQLAGDILARTNSAAPVLPCTSLFAGDEHDIQAGPGEYIVINFIKLAGHYDFSNNIDKSAWEQVMTAVYTKLQKFERIVWVCHSEKEKKQARLLDANATIFYSKNHVDYLKIYARAKYGLVNRIHAAYALAAFGKPSVVIGNDSRTRMIDLLGLERIFVNDATVDLLMHKIEKMQQNVSNFAEQSNMIKREARQQYAKVLSTLL